MTGLTVCKTEDQVAISLEIMMEEYDKYFSAHGLKINVAKCEHIVMGARRSRKVVINGREEATSNDTALLTNKMAWGDDRRFGT